MVLVCEAGLLAGSRSISVKFGRLANDAGAGTGPRLALVLARVSAA